MKKPEKKINAKNFLYSVGESNLLNFDNFIQFSSLSSNTDPNEIGNFLPLHKPKESCFTCFKLITLENSINFFNKHFCGDICKDQFAKENLVLLLTKIIYYLNFLFNLR